MSSYTKFTNDLQARGLVERLWPQKRISESSDGSPEATGRQKQEATRTGEGGGVPSEAPVVRVSPGHDRVGAHELPKRPEGYGIQGE